jgi:CBS domain-containing protein
MTFNPASCKEDDDIEHAVSLMAQRQVRRMPVIDTNGRVVGMIAQADIATRTSSDCDTGHLVESISAPPVQR